MYENGFDRVIAKKCVGKLDTINYVVFHKRKSALDQR